MNKELTKWLKDSCKDVGHVNYGKIQEIIAKDGEKPNPSIQAPEFVLRSEGGGFLRKE